MFFSILVEQGGKYSSLCGHFFNIYNIWIGFALGMQTETNFFNMFAYLCLSPLMAGVAMLAVELKRKQPVNVMSWVYVVPFILLV